MRSSPAREPASEQAKGSMKLSPVRRIGDTLPAGSAAKRLVVREALWHGDAGNRGSGDRAGDWPSGALHCTVPLRANVPPAVAVSVAVLEHSSNILGGSLS